MIHKEQVLNGRVAGIYNGIIPSPVSCSSLFRISLKQLGTSYVLHTVFSHIPYISLLISLFEIHRAELNSYSKIHRSGFLIPWGHTSLFCCDKTHDTQTNPSLPQPQRYLSIRLHPYSREKHPYLTCRAYYNMPQQITVRYMDFISWKNYPHVSLSSNIKSNHQRSHSFITQLKYTFLGVELLTVLFSLSIFDCYAILRRIIK